MIAAQKEKLFSHSRNCLSVGITQDGVPRNSFWVPWEQTAHAFNMKTPDIYFEPDDLKSEEILSQLEKFRINGCYIFVPLEDYSFISRFKKLQDLHIRNGENLKDLSFMRALTEWFMFYLEDAKLENLDDLFVDLEKRDHFMSYCMGFTACEIDDLSAIKKSGARISELVVCAPKEEYEKWKSVPALSRGFKYYELKDSE